MRHAFADAPMGSSPILSLTATRNLCEPDWGQLPEATPAAIRTLLRRCLRKDKRQRISDATDVRIEIEDAIAAPKDSGATQTAAASTSKLPWAAAVATTIIAAVMAFGLWRATRPVEHPLVRLDVDLGPDVSLGSLLGADAILSPDGTRMVTRRKIGSLREGSISPTPLNLQARREHLPFFSPDGQWVAFFTAVKLQKISVEGGSAITLCDAPNGTGGSWGEVREATSC
jgi:hypothetical protein